MVESVSEEKKSAGVGIMLVAIVAVCALILFGAYYWQIAISEGDQKKDEALELEALIESNPSAKAMFGALEKQQTIGDKYYLKYKETLPDGSAHLVEVYRHGELEFVKLSNNLFEQEAYWDAENTVVCQSDFERTLHCADAVDGKTADISKNLREFMIDYTPDTQNRELFKAGVLKFEGEPEKKEIAARTCTLVKYALDYTNLTNAQLATIGMSSSDPMLTVFGDFKTQRCFDDETGAMIYAHLEYLVKIGNYPQNHTIEYLEYEPAPLVRMRAKVNTEHSAFAQLIDRIGNTAQEIDECMEDEGNLSKCILIEAVRTQNVEVCFLDLNKEERDRCAFRIVTTTNNPSFCDKTGELKDECYLNYAYINRDESYCGAIADAQMRQECTSAIAQVKTP